MTINACRDCGVTYFDRHAMPPVPNDYQDYYSYLPGFTAAQLDYELRIRRRQARRQLGRLAQYRSGSGTLVDVGAGPGYLVHLAEELGWQAFGVEVAASATQVGRSHFGVRYRELETIDNESVDVIVCNHVLEHIARPIEFLRLLHHKLRNGGILIVHVPHQQPLSSQINNLIRKFRASRDTDCALYFPDHLTGFTAKSLAAALQRNGFRALKLYPCSQWNAAYDPFFVRNCLRDHDFSGALRKSLIGVIDNVGNLISRGAWIGGYFARDSAW